MTKNEFEKVFADCYTNMLSSASESFKKSLHEAADENGIVSNKDVASLVFVEALKANANFTKHVFEEFLQFDD